MLIYKPKQALIFRPKEPSKILTAIASAKLLEADGKEYVAVPHRPDETIRLRSLGYEVPAPMNMYYPYKGRFAPFDAQRQTAEFATMNRRCFILNSMGLGKTITSLWATDYLRSIGAIKRTLIVCPISVMERTWADEIFRAFPEASYQVLYGTRAKRLKLLEQKADYYIINTDAVRIIEEELANRDDIDHIIIDEVALFRNSAAARWKVMNRVCNKQLDGTRWVWGLTGSPVPNEPTDAFGQIKLVTPDNPDCPKWFGRFRDLVMLQHGPYKWDPKPDAVETVYRVMQPAIRFALDDVVDLPEQIHQTREVELTPEQRSAFKAMASKLMAELQDKSVTAVNEAVKASKLLQIVCGVAYGDEGEALPLPCKGRLDAADEVVCESEGKVIAFVPFSAALNRLKEHLEACGHTVAVVDGSTSKPERDEIFHLFQNTADPKVLVANPSAMSHGLTLTAATTILWYGPVYSNEIYQQACARVRRPGQKKTTVIVHLVSTEVERKIYRRLDERQSLQGTLLDMVRDTLQP